MRNAIFTALLALGLALPQLAAAQEYGSKEEAMKLTKAAIALVDKEGFEKAKDQLMDPKGRFVDRDLYVITVDLKTGNRVSHGLNPKLVGTSYAEAVDVNGKAYGKEAMELLAGKSSGWVEYAFTDPLTKKILPKEAYIEKKGDYAFVCGVYKR